MSDQASSNPRATLLRDRNFVRYMSGGILSMLGDQFTLIALPWLVLKMSGDTLVLGIVLALIGVPRAVFILIGGAMVDRHSPKRVLMLTKYVNTVLLGLLAALVLSGSLSLWMVYVLALAIGLSTAFSIPSATSLMPHVVAASHLQAANSMMLGIRQMTMFAGPVLAGTMIALVGDAQTGRAASSIGLGCAFLFDAFSFAASAWTLHKTLLLAGSGAGGVSGASGATEPAARRHVLHDVAEGLRHCWNDVSMRTCFIYWAAIMFLIAGPIQVAMPVLASRLGDSAAGFGVLVGANAGGALIGMVISGAWPGLRSMRMGAMILAIDCIVGVLFVPMGQIDAIWQGVLIMLTIGTLAGFMQVRVYTWMQQRVPRAMLGRAMSIFMFIFLGITPVSAAITGWLMRSVTTTEVFAGSGALLIAIVLVTLFATPMRSIAG